MNQPPWLRASSKIVAPEDFGAIGDGKADDFLAIQRALDSLADGDVLWCDQLYRYSSTPIARHCTISMPARLYTTKPFGFAPDAGVTGLRLGDQDVVLENVRIKGRALSKGAADAGVLVHGIDSQWKFTAWGFKISQFPGDGIHIENRPVLDSGGNPVIAGTGKPVGSVADCWSLQRGVLTGNGRHGLGVFGSAANAGLAIGVQVELNGQDGIHDESLLGNYYGACVAHSNGQARPVSDRRGFVSSHANTSQRFAKFSGCYLEDDNFALIDAPAAWVGGGDVRGTGAVLTPEVGGFQVGHLRVRGSKGAAPIETLIGGSGDDAITVGVVGKDKVALRRVPGVAGAPDLFVIVSSGKPSQPMLALDPSGALSLPLTRYEGIGVLRYRVTHGDVPPDPKTCALGDRFVVVHPKVGGFSEYRLCADAGGALAWHGVGRIEP